jgi:hypothetical protein
MGIQHRHRHAAETGECSNDMSFSIDMGMQHGPGHVAWTWTCSMDMNMMLGGHRNILALVNIFLGTFSFTFTVLPVHRPPVMAALTFSFELILNDNHQLFLHSKDDGIRKAV